MSRWTDRFKTHPFQQTWRNVKDSLLAARVNDETVPTEVAELGRLKRIISYIDGLLQSLDPELVPLSVWDNFQSQADACAQQINAFNVSRSIGHIQMANDHADNLLTYVRPYMVVTGRHAKNLRDSAAEYIATLDEYLAQFSSRATATASEIDSVLMSLEAMRADADEAKGAVTAAADDLLGVGDRTGRIADFEKRLQDFESKYGEIVDYYNETLVGEDGGESTKESITKAAISAKKDAATAREAVQGSKTLIDELTIFYGKIFGVASEDGTKVGGLDDELARQKIALGKFEEEQKIRYGALNQKIEDLLPGAASAGLASAYGQMRASFDEPLKGASRLFYAAIGGIVLVSLVMTVDKVWMWGIDFTPIGDLSTVARSFLYKLPILGPLVWLAYYASKRRSECQRLQQEYAHKEALAKSYDSYRKQIQELGGEKAEMLETLISKAVEAISYNASGTLDGRHGDSPPFQAVIDKLLDKVPDAPKVG